MAFNLEPIEYVEIDIDFCSLTYGTGSCTASLTEANPNKCYNTYKTCPVKSLFSAGILTERFATPRSNFPKDQIYYPVLSSVSTRSSTINTAGGDNKKGMLGTRATGSVTLQDFPYDDSRTDKYYLQRKSGVANLNGDTFNPIDRGTYFSKLKARWPYYIGRPIRLIKGYIRNGQIVDKRTRSYIITSMSGPTTSGSVTFEFKDILALADDDKAVYPPTSQGVLKEDIDEEATSLVLLPEGIGAEYPTSGLASIGSELVWFNRSGDTFTLTSRGMHTTSKDSHSAQDTFQICKVFTRAKIYNVLSELLNSGAGISTDMFAYQEWKTEIETWMGSLTLDTILTEPTGVNTLIGEIINLGLGIWWDEYNQLIRLKVNHVELDQESLPVINDDNSIISFSQSDDDDSRYTQMWFWSVMTDPTGSATDASNFNQLIAVVDTEAQSENAYNDTSIKKVYCRWVNRGARSILTNLSKRLLKRFNVTPVDYSVTIDAKDENSYRLGDLVFLNSRLLVDEFGENKNTLCEIQRIDGVTTGSQVKLTLRTFPYVSDRYARVGPTSLPNYTSATQAQKKKYVYIASASTGKMSNGDEAYLLA